VTFKELQKLVQSQQLGLEPNQLLQISRRIVGDDTIKNVEIFWQIFTDLEKLDSGIVEHKQLQDMLISTGKFYAGDAHYTIGQMLKTGQIVEVEGEFHKYKKREEQ
jgi:hypothetical protein